MTAIRKQSRRPRRRIAWRRVGLLLAACGAVAACCVTCRGTQESPITVHATEGVERVRQVAELLGTDSTSRWEPATLEMPEAGCVALETRPVGRYAEVFNDSNYVHWSEAAVAGIEPLADTRSHWEAGPLEKVAPCEDFYVEPLSFSSPYLVPKAARMLHEIGRRFRATLAERGGGDYRIKVTSVLRTPGSVQRLKRRNPNSIDSSAHLLATTIDISYARFICDNPAVPRRVEDLKAVLAEVLWQMRSEGWCYVKYEAKQPCFHISCRDYNF